MVDAYTVYVVTENDKIYSCYWEADWKNDCLVEVEMLPKIDPYADERSAERFTAYREHPSAEQD